MRRSLSILKWFLIGWGALSFILVTLFVALIAYQIGPGNRSVNDAASVHDVRFVLNWCNLGDDRIEKVIHSHVSSHSFTGDHLDAYAIKASHLSLEELTANKGDDMSGRWYRGDQLPKVLDDAVAFVGEIQESEFPWFPKESELRSDQFYVYPWSIYVHGIRPTSVQIIFVRPSDKMVFYIDAKT